MEVRGETIKYSSWLKKEKTRHRKELEFQLEDIGNLCNISHDDPNLKARFDNCKHELEALNKEEAEGAAMRCRAFYSLQGETPSRYFCNLEKQNAASKYMSKLNTEGGILTDQKDIEQEQELFFQPV
jgi:hypothetical protein